MTALTHIFEVSEAAETVNAHYSPCLAAILLKCGNYAGAITAMNVETKPTKPEPSKNKQEKVKPPVIKPSRLEAMNDFGFCFT